MYINETKKQGMFPRVLRGSVVRLTVMCRKARNPLGRREKIKGVWVSWYTQGKTKGYERNQLTEGKR